MALAGLTIGPRAKGEGENGMNLEIRVDIGFPGGSEGKVSAYYVGGPGSIPGSGISPGEGNGNHLGYSCLKNPMDRGTW